MTFNHAIWILGNIVFLGSLIVGAMKILQAIKKFDQSVYPRLSGHGFLHTIFHRDRRYEYFICRELETLPGYKNFLFKVRLPNEVGKTSEISLILISQKGILLLASKNYSGVVFGYENDRMWFHKVGGKKFQFHNPLWQNETRALALVNLLSGVRPLTVQSAVVFGRRCSLKKVLVSPSTPVVSAKELAGSIRQLQKNLPIIYNKKMIHLITKRLRISSDNG